MNTIAHAIYSVAQDDLSPSDFLQRIRTLLIENDDPLLAAVGDVSAEIISSQKVKLTTQSVLKRSVRGLEDSTQAFWDWSSNIYND